MLWTNEWLSSGPNLQLFSHLCEYYVILLLNLKTREYLDEIDLAVEFCCLILMIQCIYKIEVK